MRTTQTLALSLLAALATCTPLRLQGRQSTYSNLTNFLLVTTTTESAAPNGNSSLLPDVNATVLFDPYHQYTWYMRWTAAGYGSLPTFNLTDGTLHTDAYAVGTGDEEFNSTAVTVGEELSLDPTSEGSGTLALSNGYLLTVDGECKGWTVCDGTLGEQVIYWKGNDSSCVPRYIQAVTNAPY